MARKISSDLKFILPDLGEGLEEAKLIKWTVSEGDAVDEHDILAKMETDKALVEVPSPRKGTIKILHGSEGDIIKVGAVFVTYEGGIEVHAKDKDGLTPLHWAANRGHIEDIKALVEAGAEVQAKDRDGVTPLHSAAKRGHAEAIMALVEAGAEVHAKDKDGNRPIDLAAKNGHNEAMNFLIELAIHNKANNSKEHKQEKRAEFSDLLCCAAYLGYGKTITALIEDGADVHATGSASTPLHSVVHSNNEEALAKLLSATNNINVRDVYGNTPLHIAAMCDKSDSIKTLITAGAGVNIMNNAGFSPLAAASLLGRTDAIKTLIQFGADVTAKNKDGYTPLHLVAWGGDHVDAIAALIGAGAVIDSEARDGQTPYGIAHCMGNIDALFALIDSCSETEVLLDEFVEPLGGDLASHYLDCLKSCTSCQWGYDAPFILHQAIGIQNIKIIIALINDGADVNAMNRDGLAPLHIAASNGDFAAIKKLIEAGSDVNAQDSFGRTALIRAAQSGDEGQLCSLVLILHGADASIRDSNSKSAQDYWL